MQLPGFTATHRAFIVPGTAIERRALRFHCSRAGIQDYSDGVVFRHEQTLSKPKTDRLDLLRATRAHFGQIFMLYSAAGKIDALLGTSFDNASRYRSH